MGFPEGGIATLIRRIDQARPAVMYGLLAVLLAAVFVPMSLFRLVDGDEGTYLLVSRLALEGQLPYHDFFYPQMFLLPYVYGAWMKLVGYSWYGARLLSALFSIALGLLVARQVTLLTRTRAWGALAVVLFAFSSLAFGWYPLVKTFVLPTLLLFAAYAVLSIRSRWRWVASGLLLGLSVACRVYVVAVAPAFLLELYLSERDRSARLMQLARFAIGFAVALLPAELFFLIDPPTFVFNIVGNHLVRDDPGQSWWHGKTAAIRILLGIQGAEGAASVQFLFLFLGSLAAWVSSAVSRERLPLGSLIAISLIVASHVPTPVYTQYFCMPLPFLVVSAVVFFAKLADETTTPRLRHLFAPLIAAYVLVSPVDFYRYTATGDIVAGRSTPADWRISTIRTVSQTIDRELHPGRTLAISFWPGYFVETRASTMPGMENHEALYFSNKVSRREVARFRLMSTGELLWHFQQHSVDVIVLGNWTPDRAFVRDQIVANGYSMSGTIASAEIYTLASNGRR
jgi:hypothetical protein